MYVLTADGVLSVSFPIPGLDSAFSAVEMGYPGSKETLTKLLRKSLKAAQLERSKYLADGFANVQIRRAARDTSSKGLRSRPRAGITYTPLANSQKGLQPKEAHWADAVGYVNPEADKHGPAVYVPLSTLTPLRSDAEKAEWFKNYKPKEKTCLWM